MPVRSIYHQFISRKISRRQFVARLSELGVGTLAASRISRSLAASPPAQGSLQLSNVSGGQIACEILKLWGVDFVFGNSGAYEAGFLDALVDYPGIRYVMGLHEGSVMAMADGYSRITGKTSFVNVHAITGTANALGSMVNAWTDNSAVVVTVGMSDTKGDNLGVFTETAKLESVPEHYSKAAFRASQTESLPESLRRAFQLASTLPSGPVFLGVPMDVWIRRIAQAGIIPPQRSVSEGHPVPDERSIQRAAEWLAAARNPLLISGAELPRWGGLAELVEIADLLGAAVSGDTTASRSSMGFPSRHSRFLGPLAGPIESPEPFDLVFLAGTSRLTLMGSGQNLLPAEARIIEMGIREDHLARAYPADLLLYGHPKATLQLVLGALRRQRLDGQVVRARQRIGEGLKEQRQRSIEKRLKEVWDSTPIAPERLAAEINQAIDPNAIVVTETVSSDAHVRDYIDFDQPGGGRRHIISSGGSLGWGLGAACGVKLGAPNHHVVTLLGDGSFQFATQALWTIKRFELPLIIVLFNNRNYQANRWALAGLRSRAAETGRYIGISLEDPDIDHAGIARSYGVEGERVTRPEQLAPAFRRAIEAEKKGQAYLLDVIIARRGGGADSTWHEERKVTQQEKS